MGLKEDPRFILWSRHWLLAGGVMLAALSMFAGCQPPVASNAKLLKNEQTDDDHLAEAMKNLARLDEQMREDGYKQVEFHLNEWQRLQETPDDWKRDPLAGQLPKDFDFLVSDEELERKEFSPDDIRYLDEALTLRKAAEWIVAVRLADPEFLAWLEAARPRLGNQAADDLAAAERFFDWSVRNVQLEPLPGPARGKVVGPGAIDEPTRKPEPAPGAKRFPLHAMLFGRGDAWERGRVFSGLCRQHGLLASVIGFQEEGAYWPRPWVVAVAIGDQLFLFDPALGLPIPGDKGQGIATLDEIRAKPEILRQLDLEDAPYSVAASDLPRAMALIDVDPISLSRRMLRLQEKLPSDQRMALASSPTEISQRLRKFPALADVRVWSAPFQAYVYRDQIQTRPEWRVDFNTELHMYSTPPVGFGRRLQLAGHFEVGETVGAKQVYLKGRPTSSGIEELESNVEMQKAMLSPLAGGDKSKLDDENWRKANFVFLRNHIKEMQLQTSYWLGMATFDTRHYAAARNHFQDRVLKDFPDSNRETGALYNLARSCEALGQYDEAIAIYLADKSPQRNGNRIRAKWLEKKKAP